MKTITKIMATVATSVLLFASTNSNAQTTDNGRAFKVGIGASAGIFKDRSPLDYGFGGDLKLQWDLSHYVALTASGGYTKLKGKTGIPDYQFIPVIGGVRIFPVGRLYLAPQVGVGFAIKDGDKTNLIYAGGIGYEWKNGLDLGVRYEGYTNNSASPVYIKRTGQYALRLGYNFKF